VEEINEFEKTPLVMPLKLATDPVDRLKTILIFKRLELVVVDKIPRQCSNNIDSIQMHGSSASLSGSL